MLSDLLERKRTSFVLWRPGVVDPPPVLSIGEAGQSVGEFRAVPLHQDSEFSDLWLVAASDCQLQSGKVYLYGFKVRISEPFAADGSEFLITDPLALAVDRSFGPPAGLPELSYETPSGDPLSLIAFVDGQLVACDRGADNEPIFPEWPQEDIDDLPVNDSIVIYEMPTRWAHRDTAGALTYANGTFQDVQCLLEIDSKSPSFPDSKGLNDRALLKELGVNVLEMLPCSDQDDIVDWGYGMANYFAADYHLGKPRGQSTSTATRDLVCLISICHRNNVRVFLDSAMSWSRNNPYVYINYLEFFLKDATDPEWGDRNGWGGQLPKFNYSVQGYDPITGRELSIVPIRQLFEMYILHWMNYYHIDGLRLDDIPNFPNGFDGLPNFLNEINLFARQSWRDRGGQDACFLTVGEDLNVPPDIDRINKGQVDGLWNDSFRIIARSALLGEAWSGEPSFEKSVQDLIDPRNLGFTDTSQIVNYLGSHDTGNTNNQRLYNWFIDNGVVEPAQRIKLGFACLLTAIGIPMILAGDEFADEMDAPPAGTTFDNYKEEDPVNWSLLDDEWRQDLFDTVSRLVKLRTTSAALRLMEINFIHADFSEGKKVMAWQRGSGDDLVIVVANFSDWSTPNPADPASNYIVNNWPSLPSGYSWTEVTKNRPAPNAGRETITAWQGNVYTVTAT
jgi:pullulanase